jgi:hypothetical protein
MKRDGTLPLLARLENEPRSHLIFPLFTYLQIYLLEQFLLSVSAKKLFQYLIMSLNCQPMNGASNSLKPSSLLVMLRLARALSNHSITMREPGSIRTFSFRHPKTVLLVKVLIQKVSQNVSLQTITSLHWLFNFVEAGFPPACYILGTISEFDLFHQSQDNFLARRTYTTGATLGSPE